MKKYSILLVLIMYICCLSSCNNEETYADQLSREKAAIEKYIKDHNIKVISEGQFFANDTTTDVSKNEYVLLNASGVYMQIVNKGCGSKLKDGETATVLCRFNEYNLLTDSLILSNNVLYYSAIVDKMSVTNTSGTYSASFDPNSSVMYIAYHASNSTSVPGGWLAAMPYIKIGRPKSAEEQIARVNVIVPSAEGTATASANVTPCFYEITYQRGR